MQITMGKISNQSLVTMVITTVPRSGFEGEGLEPPGAKRFSSFVTPFKRMSNLKDQLASNSCQILYQNLLGVALAGGRAGRG